MRSARFWVWGALTGLLSCSCVSVLGTAHAQTFQQLQRLSIDELANISITSVTKMAGPLSDAAAAVYVITHDDIVRSGAVTVPEILRLAPNLQVNQVSASRYIITARGFSGNIAAQNFANKLLVLIDGRSVYTPLFSGVYWDMQDVLPEDIDRIEVISGPGATLWGSNAVNGVINIITRKSSETKGGLVEARGGNLAQVYSARFGGDITDRLSYRAYFRDYIGDNTLTQNNLNAHDRWSRQQGGFRMDWEASQSDSVTFQGDLYRGSLRQPGTANQIIEGHNLLARWIHTWEGGSSLQVQGYYDRLSRADQANAGSFWQNTYDIDMQHNFTLYDRHRITWGGGYRSVYYRINSSPGLLFEPPSRTLTIGNLFVQDSIAINDKITAILGLKVESAPYIGPTPLPSGRLSWKVTDTTLLWAAVSRAIRAPTPFERDVVEKIGSTVFLVGNSNFQPEKLTAYELGLRMEPTPKLSFSVSGFYNVYDGLRSIEITPVTFLPLTWGNLLKGETYGAEVWGQYQLQPWWRLSFSFVELVQNFRFAQGSSRILGTSQLGNDPEQRASLRSSVDLGEDVSLYAELRYVGQLPNPRVPDFVELNASLGWNFTPRLRFYLSGFNLLHRVHYEFAPTDANAIPRSVMAGVQWRF